MSVLRIDFETRATVDLKATGVYPYARHPETDVWCMGYAFDEEEVLLWTPGMVPPARICAHVRSEGEIRAWNAQFERLIWRHILAPRYGFPLCYDRSFVCTAAEAAAMALPRSLDHAAKVLGIAQKKDTEGYQLMMKLTRPRKTKDETLLWWDDPTMLARLGEYCKQDVRTERAAEKALRRLSAQEREIYLLDQRMNDRGVAIDRPLIDKAQALVAEGLERAGLALAELTEGKITRVTQSARIAQYVGRGSLAKDKVADLLEEADLDPEMRQILSIRAEAGRSSTSKLHTLLEYAGDTSRVCGTTLYHGAATGRWSGKGPQPHNFPKGDILHIEQYIPLVMTLGYDELNSIANPIQVVSSMLRSMLIAAMGYDLIVGDFAAIEARVLNWLAGQDDVTAKFAAGVDIYKQNAATLYQMSVDHVLKIPHRHTGKFQELACGYQMGWEKAHAAAKSTYGLTITPAFAEEIVDSYRATHPKVVAFWHDTNSAVMQAVRNPGVVQHVGVRESVRIIVRGGYLYIILPSGRPLCYAKPRIVGVLPRRLPCPPSCMNAAPKHEHWTQGSSAVEFECVDGATKRWVAERGYGGLWVENIVQAVSRDIMAEAMLELDRCGYPLILTVHDEIVAEIPQGVGTTKEFEQVMRTVPSWAAGCPIAVEVWRGPRYKK